MHGALVSPHLPQHALLSVTWTLPILGAVDWDLPGVLICLALIPDDHGEHLFIGFLANRRPSWTNAYPDALLRCVFGSFCLLCFC